MSTTTTGVETEAVRYPGEFALLSGIRFDWFAALLSTLFTAGLFLDGWAHSHGKVDDSFFTVWHAVFYSGFLLYAVFLIGALLANYSRRFSMRLALPDGYGLSLAGAAIFAIGGAGDLIWHTLFGIEDNIEALLSPTHLLLGLGMTLMVSGPLRAAWSKPIGAERRVSWKQAGPLLVSLSMMLAIFTFLTQYAHPLVHLVGNDGGPEPWWLTQSVGISSVLLQSAILMGFVLPAARRWRLPFGWLTLVLGLNATLLSFMEDTFFLILPMLLAGLLGDVLYVTIRPSNHRYRFYLFAFLVPVGVYTLYFTDIALRRELTWIIHLWAGTIVLAGVAGLLLAILLAQSGPETMGGIYNTHADR